MTLRKNESIFFRGMGIFILVLSLYLSSCANPDSERGNSRQQLEDTEGIPLDDETTGRLQAILDRATSYSHVKGIEVAPADQGMPPIPGVVVGISMPGKQTWYGTSGVSNLETRAPIRADEIFRLGSVTKTYTGTLILQLSEEIEAFSLDDPIEKWLPGKIKNGDEITIRNLLTHTSCIANYGHIKAFDDAFVANTTGRWTPEQLISIANEAEPDCIFESDALVLHYSNINGKWLVISRCPGNRFSLTFRRMRFPFVLVLQFSNIIGK